MYILKWVLKASPVLDLTGTLKDQTGTESKWECIVKGNIDLCIGEKDIWN
jgi:hypothetical protein